METVTIDHIGIAVRSIDEALGMYRDALGLDPVSRTVVEHERVEAAVLPTGGGRIELLQPTSDDSVIARFLRRRGQGVHHVALRVDNLEEAIETLRNSGRRLVTDRIQIGAEGYRYVFVHPGSTGGVLLELVERDRRQ
ncbi:MAG: methylmalonyl-CoA epimerase [Bryobacterales bacterium]|nr:methylmalonyl-CoA epimerase [Bryobacterales bacterium]